MVNLNQEDEQAQEQFEIFKQFMRLHRALVAWYPCGDLVTVSFELNYKVLPLRGTYLVQRSYKGKHVAESTFSTNEIFRVAKLPDDATGFAVFTGCCLTFICLCSTSVRAAQMLRCVPSFTHHHGQRLLSDDYAWCTVQQYLDGLRMFGIERDYCYFGHQKGLDGLGECFLGPDGGLDFAYIPCYSRAGFEPGCIPVELMQV